MKLLTFLSFSTCTDEQNELLELENIQLKQMLKNLTEKVFVLDKINKELIVENKELVDELNGIEDDCFENIKRFNETFGLCEGTFTKCKKAEESSVINVIDKDLNVIDEECKTSQPKKDNLFDFNVDSSIKHKEKTSNSEPKPISHEHIKLNNVNYEIKDELFEILWQVDAKKVEIFATEFILQGSNDVFSFNESRPISICTLSSENCIVCEGILYFTQIRRLRKNAYTYYRIKMTKDNEISYSNTIRIRKY